MDILSIIGVIIGFAALLGGNFIEGGAISSLINGPAALIVFGGTLGAAMLQTPMVHLKRALKIFRWIFRPPTNAFRGGIDKIVRWAVTARREGLLGLEQIADRETDPFARKGLQMMVDGTEPEVIRRVMENELILDEQRDQDAVKFYESMG